MVPLLFVRTLSPPPPPLLLMHRNSATDAVQQELLFVGQEAGKLIAMRNIIKKVHTWFPAIAVYTYSTSLTSCTMFLQLHPSISPFASGDTLFLFCAHMHACAHTHAMYAHTHTHQTLTKHHTLMCIVYQLCTGVHAPSVGVCAVDRESQRAVS